MRPAKPTSRRPRIRLRDLGPDDGHVLDAVFAAMSSRSRYLRFHGPMPSLPDSMRRVLATVDGHQHVAVAAEARVGRRWQPVGIARLVQTEAGRAEMAVEVADAFHGQGIGTRLVRAVRDHAVRLGLRRVVAEILAENEAMLAVFRREMVAAHAERDGDVVRMTWRVVDPTDLSFTIEDLFGALH